MGSFRHHRTHTARGFLLALPPSVPRLSIGSPRLCSGHVTEALHSFDRLRRRSYCHLLLLVFVAVYRLFTCGGEFSLLFSGPKAYRCFKTLFRVWDVLLVDGVDVLFRLAFSILRIGEQELLLCESVPAVYVALESLPTRMWESDKLLQASHSRPRLCSELTYSYSV